MIHVSCKTVSTALTPTVARLRDGLTRCGLAGLLLSGPYFIGAANGAAVPSGLVRESISVSAVVMERCTVASSGQVAGARVACIAGTPYTVGSAASLSAEAEAPVTSHPDRSTVLVTF